MVVVVPLERRVGVITFIVLVKELPGTIVIKLADGRNFPIDKGVRGVLSVTNGEKITSVRDSTFSLLLPRTNPDRETPPV